MANQIEIEIEMIDISVQRWSCFTLDAFEELCKTFSRIKNIIIYVLTNNYQSLYEFIYVFNIL